MTDNEIFNKVAAHLLSQGKQAMERGKCVYRTSDGLSCAVGCLIAPEAYSSGLEGQGTASLDVRAALRDSGIEPTYPNMVLLSDLQDLHDRCPPHKWPTELDRIRRNLGVEENGHVHS